MKDFRKREVKSKEDLKAEGEKVFDKFEGKQIVGHALIIPNGDKKKAVRTLHFDDGSTQNVDEKGEVTSKKIEYKRRPKEDIGSEE